MYLNGQLYAKTGSRPATLINAIDFDEHFDLDNPRPVRLPVRELCNQLIHHYVLFAVRGDQQRFEVVLVFSDYKRHACLYEFDVNNLLELFEFFASEEAAPYRDQLVMVWDEKKQDYIVRTEPAPAA